MAASFLRFSFKPYRRPFRIPIRTSRGLWEVREGILVRLEMEDGRAGYGEIAPIESFGTETFAGAVAWCGSVSSKAEPAALRDVPRGMPCCAAALAAAWRVIDGRPSVPDGNVEIGAALLLPSGVAALDMLERAVDAGFSVFKIKIGAADISAEMEIIMRLAERLPTGGLMRLDANGGLDVRQAVRWLDFCAGLPIEFIEQPLDVGADRDLARLASDFETKIALDESVRDADDVKRWRDRGWPGVFVIKPSLAGAGVDLREEILIAPGDFVISSALETSIGAKAGLELAFSTGASRALGYGVGVFFDEADGLGGALAAPRISWRNVRELDLEAIWNRL